MPHTRKKTAGEMIVKSTNLLSWSNGKVIWSKVLFYWTWILFSWMYLQFFPMSSFSASTMWLGVEKLREFDWLHALSIKIKYSRRPASFSHTSLRFRLIDFVSVQTLVLPVEFKIELSGFQHLTAQCDLLPFRIVKLWLTRLNVDYSCHK